MQLITVSKQEKYQSTIYLNDHPYDVLDIGEGRCSIIIVEDIDAYLENLSNPLINNRIILVDVSKMLVRQTNGRESIESLLAKDLHLLFDVFWLEEVDVRAEVPSLKMSEIYSVVSIRNYSCSLLKRNALSATAR
ncbi:hypothetical protein AB8613_22895 [Vibrio sp. BS-M-Sm-2]|uniref:hypothetical protein n=1 Tax=unclassified Vibrio TaxID=2614977 RepID=UPI00255B4791|nr:hypothetical protein [Vibrio sp. TMPB1044]MDL5028917.1 hypothetical protein [Vibrio sp. TMPB1044]MDN5209045.1 hypothetical protein [Vibrio sp. TMPB1044]